MTICQGGFKNPKGNILPEHFGLEPDDPVMERFKAISLTFTSLKLHKNHESHPIPPRSCIQLNKSEVPITLLREGGIDGTEKLEGSNCERKR